jgi:hypothetical protein
MNKIIGKNIFWYICLLVPLTYTIGIAVTETFVLITIIFFFYINRNLDNFKDKKILFLFLFSFYIAINSIIQITYNDLKIQSIFHFRFVIFSMSIIFILNHFDDNKKFQNYLLRFIFLLITFIIFDALYQFFIGKNIFGFEIIRNRISGIFEDELILGSFLLRIFPLVLWLIFYSKFDIKRNQHKLYFFFSFYFITIYLSGERTSLILLFISSILYLFFLKQVRKILITSLIVLLSFMVITATVNVGKSDPFNRFFVKTFNQIQNKFSIEHNNKIQLNNPELKSKKNEKTNNKIFIFSDHHNQHLVLAFHLFLENPIFGKGPGGFRNYCRNVMYNSKIGMCTTHPHNFLMQILSETGLIGFMFYMMGFIFLIIKLFKNYKKDIDINNKSCFVVCTVALLISFFPLAPSGNFFNNWIMIINHYYIGLYLLEYNKIQYK